MKDKIGIGFIGTGFARKVQMPAFAACGDARLVSVSSGSIENAKAAAEEFGIDHFTDDWRETVSHPDVDLVCITTPPVMHHEMVMFAIENKKHLWRKPSELSGSGEMTQIVLRMSSLDRSRTSIFRPNEGEGDAAEGSIGKVGCKIHAARTAAIRRPNGIGGLTLKPVVVRWGRLIPT